MSDVVRFNGTAHRDDLATLLRFIDERCSRAELRGEDAHAVRLAVEEVCENVVKYGYVGRSAGPIAVQFSSSPEQVSVSIEDSGVAFDPTELLPADTTSDWRSRPLGGLGWHLVRQLMDDVRYERIPGGGNRVTLVKRRTATL